MSTMQDMQFGVVLWNVGAAEYTNPAAFRQIARATEEHGFDFLWAGEHVVIPEDVPDEYPFTPDGKSPLHSGQSSYDVFDLLSYVAGMTSDLTVGTNLSVVPYRHPVVLAKHVLTMMELTDGRFEFGAGPGWLRTEFEVLDVPFEERGPRTDEFFRMFERICEEGQLAFDGEFHSFQETGFFPVPEDGETPTTFFGGTSGATMRRIAEFGDGWSIFWSKPDEVAATRERMMRAWSDFDRDGEPEIAVCRPVHVGTDTDRDTSGLLVGEPESILEDIEAYREAGTTRLLLTTYDVDLETQLEQIERFGDRVLSQL